MKERFAIFTVRGEHVKLHRTKMPSVHTRTRTHTLWVQIKQRHRNKISGRHQCPYPNGDVVL